MKHLIKKSVLFCSILLLIKMPFVFFYEGELEQRKLDFAARDFNTVFVGSSRTKYAIIPAYFDFLTSGKTASYNFGVDAALPPYSIDECEKLIDNQPALKHIFFELSGESYVSVPKEPLKNFSFQKYLNAVKNLPLNDFSTYHNLLVVNMLKPKVTNRYPDYNDSLEKIFEQKVFQDKKPLSLKTIHWSHRRNLQIEENNDRRYSLNETYWRRISRLIEFAESKNIKIYFFVPPRLNTDHELETILPIYHSLDNKYKLAVAHDDEAFYRDDTSFDDLHLNFTGAKLFTEKLSEAFIKHRQ